ncbi:MAG: hypothetical protein IPK82_33760 [Polyangiaceae bacterium]|nr:hypothetical protein [Polyangiaceae bacterium]
MSSIHRNVAVFASAVLALSMPIGCGGKKKPGPKGSSSAAAVPTMPPEPDGIRRYRGITTGREIMATHAMDPKDAVTAWHYRVEWLNNKVIKYERVSPAGHVNETVLVEYKPDGSRVEHVRNAYGIEIYSDSVDRTSVVTRTWRSGEVIYDGCYWRRRAFDSFGRMETETCLDDKSSIITDTNGCAIVKYQYTVNNDVQVKMCLNSDLSPAIDANGVHRTTYDQDLYGYLTDESYYGLKNERVPRLSDGCVRIQYKRDEAGNAAETVCADEKGQSTFVRGGAYTTIAGKFDANGCLVEKKYVDFEGKTPKKGNFGSEVYTVDKTCGILSRQSKDPRGRGVQFSPSRPVSEEFTLGPDGAWTQRVCKGASGPVACVDPRRVGARGSIVMVERDEQGRITRERCFQAADKPSPCEAGYPHERRLEYGPDGRVRVESSLDEKGHPSLGLGSAQVERKYTSVGKKQTENSLDKDGQPMVNKLGFASITFQYDAQQRLSLIQLQGIDGQPKAARNLAYGAITWPPGAAKMSIDRETDGRIANIYLGPDDKQVKRVECTDLSVPCYRR